MHGVAKDWTVAMGNAQQKGIVAHHANRPEEGEWNDAHFTILDANLGATKPPTSKPAIWGKGSSTCDLLGGVEDDLNVAFDGV